MEGRGQKNFPRLRAKKKALLNNSGGFVFILSKGFSKDVGELCENFVLFKICMIVSGSRDYFRFKVGRGCRKFGNH